MLRKLVLALCAAVLFCGCSQKKPTEQFSQTVYAMDTVMDLSVWDHDDQALKEACSLIPELEKKFSATDPGSEIWQLNHTGSASLSPDTAELVGTALELCSKTGGVLDLSIYPVVRAWGFTTGSYQVPADDQLQQLLQAVDYEKIRFSPEQASIALPSGMEIDLGSVAKGYTGDRVTRLLRDRGVSSALLNLGGNVQALGSKPDGSPWRIGIQDPLGDGYLGVLSMKDLAVITSGGYERYFTDAEGTVYWHIIDPATGRPARNGLISATAVGPSGVYCDALSTSLFIMGPEKATAFWQTHQDFEMILVTDAGEVLITPGLQESFQLTGNPFYYLTVIGHA